MKNSIYFLFIILMISIMKTSAQSNTQKLNVMPYPRTIEFLEGKFRVDKQILLSYDLDSKKLENELNRFLRRLSDRTGLFLEHPFAYKNHDNPSIIIGSDLVSEVKLGIDESYSINILDDKLLVKSTTDIGAIRALETILQLLDSDENGYYFPQVNIVDNPRFPWRGLMIDACRHFMPVEVIKRNLDGMATVKMNVLHWHLSEDQGFRVESKTFPKLHEFGSDGFYYTHEQIKDVINYAAQRGIRVIPEFDIPGHSTSWLVGYPELASMPGPYKIERKFGIKDPSFNPAIEETYSFFDKFFKEISDLFPDEYIHIGGDENNGKHWDKNEDIQNFMTQNNLQNNHELQAYFNNRISLILKKYDKKMIGWDEILHDKIPKDIVIQSWRGKKALVESAQKGYKGILSNGYYIDLVQPTEFHYLNDPILEDGNLSSEQEARILGGEATMWSEWVTPENVDSRIWPRTAAIAERFWSSREIIDLDFMFRRLERVSLQLEEHGLTHISFQEKMMRRLTDGRSTKSLKILLDVIEPLKEYKRAGDAKKHGFQFTQQSPYTRIIDATTVDPKMVRKFNKLVDEFIASENFNKTIYDELKRIIDVWNHNHEKLFPIIKSSPILFEIEPMSEKLKSISQLGIDILEIIKNGKTINNDWIQESLVIIESAKEPVAQTELMIVNAIEKLFNSTTEEK